MSVKQRLLDAGVALLFEQGIAALTQPRIAREAGVSQSHLTYYFPTRDDLLLAVAEHSVSTEMTRLAAGNAASASADLATTIRYQPRIRMILGLVVTADKDPATRVVVARLIDHVRNGLDQLLRNLGYAPNASEVLVFHATVIGLALMNLGQQSDHSQDELEIGLRQAFAMLPRTATSPEPIAQPQDTEKSGKKKREPS